MSRVQLLFLLIPLAVSAQAERPDKVIADFEGKDYGAWKTTGEAFGPAPARGTLPGQMPVSGYEGEGLVNSFFRGDKTTGTLTSPEFAIERKHLTFLIGGGGHAGKTCMNLLFNGKVVRTATGSNTQAGGSELLEASGWDVAEFAGKNVRLEIVDQASGGWGHINVDHIVQTDRKPAVIPREVRREILADKRYLVLPVQTGQPKRHVAILLDGQPWREFEIELADRKTDFAAIVDLAEVRGKKITLRAERTPEALPGWRDIATNAALPDTAVAYREKYRPGFHFTSRRGWLNDPNGMVFLDGEWHLYYQHNPYGWAWGNMHWGHATSKDLLHWKEQPIAIYPRQFGDWAFSGSAVVDRANTSGWKQGNADVLVAAWTSTGRGECISYSTDRGTTWREYEGNPVVKHKGRDPRLLWHAPSKQWVMAVYTEADGKQWIAFYTSPDLKKWTYQSRIEGFYECPDIFELPVEGKKNSLWVLHAADGKYLLGDFDGTTFRPTSPKKQQLWHGDFYAAQTFSDAPEGRRIQIGWGRGITFPGMPFNQQMDIPCELTLRETADGVRLCAIPVRELEKLAYKDKTMRPPVTNLVANRLARFEVLGGGDLFDVQFTLNPGKATRIVFTLAGVGIVYDTRTETLACRGKSIPLKRAEALKLRVLIDRGSVEIFTGNGETALVAGGLLDKDRTFSLMSEGGPASVRDLTIAPLKSAWE